MSAAFAARVETADAEVGRRRAAVGDHPTAADIGELVDFVRGHSRLFVLTGAGF
jgi:hypothetical protein